MKHNPTLTPLAEVTNENKEYIKA